VILILIFSQTGIHNIESIHLKMMNLWSKWIQYFIFSQMIEELYNILNLQINGKLNLENMNLEKDFFKVEKI